MFRRGFSLLECILGIFLLTFLVFLTNAYIMTFMKTNQSIKNLSTASSLAQGKLEDIRLKSYKDIIPGTDTVKAKFIRSWEVFDNGAFKKIKVTVSWQTHKIEFATIIAK